jgi:hypothetical protein
MATYSFIDVGASLSGPGGTVNLGFCAGVAEEGITVEPTEDRNTMTIGADGKVMHSLHAGNSGTVRVRLLKTSETNALLQEMFNTQQLSGRDWGRNQITIRDFQRGDSVQCEDVAFARIPTVDYGKVAGMVEWVFHAGHISQLLGRGQPAVAV